MDYITFLVIIIISTAFGVSEGAIRFLILIFGGRKIKRTVPKICGEFSRFLLQRPVAKSLADIKDIVLTTS